jgi:hypothetical protein
VFGFSAPWSIRPRDRVRSSEAPRAAEGRWTSDARARRAGREPSRMRAAPCGEGVTSAREVVLALFVGWLCSASMPSLLSNDVYKRAFDVTYDLLSGNPAELLAPEVTLRFMPGTPLYRYSSKKVSDGGEKNTRKVWRSLASDTDNRWSGVDPNGGGITGLYLALENDGVLHTEFSELVHYQQDENARDESPTAVRLQKYAKEGKPVELTVVDNLFFMWLFFTTKALTGINLDISHPGNTSPFMKKIFMKIAGHPSLKGQTPEQWYLHDKDASFCRGIGNACLADHRFDFIRVTSARSKNLSARNIVIPHVGGVATEPYAFLNCVGRSSFIINKDGTFDAQTTEADKAYTGTL